MRNSKYENHSNTLMAETNEVCDGIYLNIMPRYLSYIHAAAVKLFNKKSFTRLKNELPTEVMVLTSESYRIIDKENLKLN